MMILLLLPLLMACKGAGSAAAGEETVQSGVGPTFSADSAYVYCQRQCDFGPRTMNSEAHEQCAEWIQQQFERFGCTVSLQKADLKGYDGTVLRSTNIIARAFPERKTRIMLCAHYDSRPWADNDPDENNHHTPVMGANDGASGVAVMMEVARLLQAADSAKIGVDFVCFDAEDYGTPQWYEGESQLEDPWALGAQHWARQFAANPQEGLRFGILLDMVGGEGTTFYQEGKSLELAKQYVDYVWAAASAAGYSSLFSTKAGGYVTDDHVPVNEIAGIPCIDIIPHYPDCQQSSFGPTWHTVSDTMEHISKTTLEAVGQTLIQVIYSLVPEE